LEILKQASTLADKGRAAELAAWEMSAREGVLKRRMESAYGSTPWIEGEAKAGRKSNLERQSIEMDVPSQDVEQDG
jgi:hypothetical protein